MPSNEVGLRITGDSSDFVAAQKAADAAARELDASLGSQVLASEAASAAESIAALAVTELASAQRGLALASKDAASASGALERAEQSLVLARQKAEESQARAIAAYDAKAQAAAQAAQREAAAQAAVASAADQSTKAQAAAQRDLAAATRARVKSDEAVEKAASRVSAASESAAAAAARVAEAHTRAQTAAQARLRASDAVREAEAGVAQASEVAAAASHAAAAASDAATAARLRESQAAAQAARTVSESQRQQLAPQPMGPAAPSARGLEYLESLRQQIAAQREQQILLEGGAQALARHRAAQAGVSAEAERYITQLHGVAGAHGKATLTAGQMAQNMRMLPMQMGDVAVSLASGMPPLMVLMQQGFQIKDMYGSVGGALKAVAGYVVGLVNPLTIAAAGLALVAAAAYSAGSAHSQLANAVTMSGGAIGLSADQMGRLAAESAAHSGATSGAAADAMTAMAQAGGVASDMLGRATESALMLERAGGQSIEATVKAFSELGKDPLQASIKLNESLGFLNISTYEQIKRAEEMGDKLGAAKIAQEAYSQAADAAAKKMLENQGLLASGWLKVTDFAAKAWNAMAGPGASASSKELASLKDRAALGDELSDAEWARISALEAQGRKEADAAAAAEKQRQQLQARAAWDRTITDSLNQYMSKADRLAKLEEKIAKIKAQGAAAGADQVEIDAKIAQARDAEKKIEKKEEPKKKKGEKGPSVTQDFERELSELKAAHAEQNAENGTFLKFSESEELKFWQSKISQVQKGTKEETAIRKKIADLRVAINKGEYDAEIEGLKNLEAEAGKNADARLAAVEKTHSAIVARFGVESKEAVESARAVSAAKLAAEAQNQQLAEIAAARTDSMRLSGIAAEQEAADLAVQMGLQTNAQRLAAEEEFQRRIFEIKRAALEREKALISPDKDPVAFAQITSKIEDIEVSQTQKMTEIGRKRVIDQNADWKSFADGVGSSFSSAIMQFDGSAKSVGNAVNTVFSGILQAGMAIPAKIAQEWIAGQIMQQAATVSTAGVQISAAAGVAGANALASNAAAPWPMGLGAPAIAAGMVAAVLGFKALASAEGGWYDTGAGNPLTQLHAREMVLPAAIANPMRAAIGAMPALPALASRLPEIAGRLSLPADRIRPPQITAQPSPGGGSSFVGRAVTQPQAASAGNRTSYNSTYNIHVQGRGMDDAALARKIRGEIASIKSNRRPIDGK